MPVLGNKVLIIIIIIVVVVVVVVIITRQNVCLVDCVGFSLVTICGPALV